MLLCGWSMFPATHLSHMLAPTPPTPTAPGEGGRELAALAKGQFPCSMSPPEVTKLGSGGEIIGIA